MKRFLTIMFVVCMVMQAALLALPAQAAEAVDYDYASTYYDGDAPTNTWTYTPFANATPATFAAYYNGANNQQGVQQPTIRISNNDTTVFIMIEHNLAADQWPTGKYNIGFAVHPQHDDCIGDECPLYAKYAWSGNRSVGVAYEGIDMNATHYATDKIYNKYPSNSSNAVRVMFEFQPYGGEQIPADAILDMEAFLRLDGLDFSAFEGGAANQWAQMGWATWTEAGKKNIESWTDTFNQSVGVQVKLAHKCVAGDELYSDNANHFNRCTLCGEAMNVASHDNKGVGACTVCGEYGYDYASTYMLGTMPTDLGNETAFANAPKATLSRTYHNNCSLTPAPTIQIVNDDTTVYMNIRTFLKTNYWPKNNYNYAFAVHAPHDDCPGLDTCTQYAQYSMSAKGAMNHTASPVDMKATNYANGGDSMIWNSADRNGWMNAKIAFQPFGGETIPEGTIIMMEVTAGNTGDGYLIDDNDTKVWSTYGWSTNATTQISAWSATNFDIPNAVAVKLASHPCTGGHTAVEIPAVPATCTEDGATAGSECSVCGEVLVAPETIPAGHTAEEIPAVPATCTENGSTAGSKCSVCDEVLVAPEAVEALGHTAGEWQYDDEGHWTECTVCGEIADAKAAHAEEGTCVCGKEIVATVYELIDDQIYADGELVAAYKTYVVDGKTYFVGDYNKIVKDKAVYVDGAWMPFGADGALTTEKVVLPISATTLYAFENGARSTTLYGLFETADATYYVGDGYCVVTDAEAWVKGTYWYFDATGAKATGTVLFNDRVYVEGEWLRAYAVVNIDGNWYKVSDYHKIAKNISVYINNPEIGAPGYYNVGADGIIEINA